MYIQQAEYSSQKTWRKSYPLLTRAWFGWFETEVALQNNDSLKLQTHLTVLAQAEKFLFNISWMTLVLKHWSLNAETEKVGGCYEKKKMIAWGLEKAERRSGSERPKGHCDDKDKTEIRETERESVMFNRWRITSAGDITMSAVLNMKDDTFMCEAIKCDEARPGGIGRIYSLSLTLSPPTSFLCLSFFVSFSTAQLTSSPCILLPFFFLDLAKKHTVIQLMQYCLLFYDPPCSPSVSQSVYLSPRDHICVTLSALSLSLSILSYLHGFSCL